MEGYKKESINIENWNFSYIYYKIENLNGISYFFWYFDNMEFEFKIPYILITSKYKGNKIEYIKEFLNNCIESYNNYKNSGYKDEDLETFYNEILKYYKNKN